jgi:hypothetical protein
MRKADLRKNHDTFEGAIVRYSDLLSRLLPAQRVVRTVDDKREVAESALLKLCSHWEAFMVEELIDCINIDCSQLSTYLGLTLPKHLSRDMCEAILMKDGYLDFRSIGDLKGTAKKMLPSKLDPFSKIKAATAKKIDEVYKLRNYLSHRSRASARALMRMYEANYGMKAFVDPGRFLLAYDAKRLLDYFTAFVDASNEMATII